MTVDLVPSTDLVPSLPSRIVTVNVTDAQEGEWAADQSIHFRIVGDVHVAADKRIVLGHDGVRLPLPEGRGQVRLPVWSSATGEWAIEVAPSWTPHPYYIRVPAGSGSVDLSQINPLHPVDQAIAQWLLTNASVTTEEGPEWDAHVSVTGGTARFHFTIPPGGEAWSRGTITTGDLNDYTTPGTYRIPAITGIDNLPPRPRAGSLEVIPQLSGTTPVLQRYSYVNSFDNPQVFVRAGGGSNWGPWTNIGSSATLIDSGTNVDTLIYPMRWMTALAVTTNGLIGLPAECRSGPIILDVSRTVGSASIARSLQEVTLLLTDAPPRRWMRSIDLVEGPTEWVEVTHTGNGGNGTHTPVMIGWGSSTIRLAQDELSDLAASMGGAYVHAGRGGDLAAHIAARLGATPALLTFPSNQIPASGSVTVTASNMPARDTSSWAGTVSGVHGELTLTYSGFTFTRTTPGTAVTSPPDAPFIPSLGMQHRNAETIILNIGKNDMVNTGGDTEAINVTAACWDYLQPLVPERTLVMGHFVNTNTTAESPNRARIEAVNSAFAATYGERYIDLGAAITSPDVWDEVGLTPTSTDTTQQALGNLPPSLGMDTAHLNEHGNRVLARLVRDRLTAMRSL